MKINLFKNYSSYLIFLLLVLVMIVFSVDSASAATLSQAGEIKVSGEVREHLTYQEVDSSKATISTNYRSGYVLQNGDRVYVTSTAEEDTFDLNGDNVVLSVGF